MASFLFARAAMMIGSRWCYDGVSVTYMEVVCMVCIQELIVCCNVNVWASFVMCSVTSFPWKDSSAEGKASSEIVHFKDDGGVTQVLLA